MTGEWPVTALDPVRRLRVMAAGVPGAVHAERVIAAGFDDVWTIASDLENELPHLLADVLSMRVTPGPGDRLTAHARGRLGQRARFVVVMRPGWCWMQSRFLIAGMAAVAVDDRTRFAFLGALRVPGVRLIGSLLSRFDREPASAAIARLEERVRSRRE